MKIRQLFKLVLFTWPFCLSQPITAQIDEFPILLPNHQQFISKYLNKNKINISEVRQTTDFLTNSTIYTLNGIPIPKRKKAFVRFVKQLNEQLEQLYFMNKDLDSTSMQLLVKLEYLNKSFITKIYSNANPNPSLKELIELGKTTKKSKHYFNYTIVEDSTSSVANSIFWHQVNENRAVQFDKEAKSQKIKSKEEMFVLFNELSLGGSAPKVNTLDLDLDNEWVLKWGDELHSDIAASRLFSAVGYNVDHPYFYGKEKLTLIFDSTKTIYNWIQLKDSIFTQYKIDIQPYFSNKGRINDSMVSISKSLAPYLGYEYVQFVKCGLEGRPDRVKRIGTFLPNDMLNSDRKELRAVLLLHAFVGNWDTREENTLLTLVHQGNHKYILSAVFSDLGTSFGVCIKPWSMDFKVGLVNQFEWEVVERKGNKVHIKNAINSILDPYELTSYSDLKWMAGQIAILDSATLRKCLAEAHWPDAIEELYFHKLASRRASILSSFDIVDPHPIPFDKKLTIIENGKKIIRNGKLITDYKRDENPESFYRIKGRKRNYGN